MSLTAVGYFGRVALPGPLAWATTGPDLQRRSLPFAPTYGPKRFLPIHLLAPSCPRLRATSFISGKHLSHSTHKAKVKMST